MDLQVIQLVQSPACEPANATECVELAKQVAIGNWVANLLVVSAVLFLPVKYAIRLAQRW